MGYGVPVVIYMFGGGTRFLREMKLLSLDIWLCEDCRSRHENAVRYALSI